MDLFSTVKYQLYLLQLENYELGRYWKLISSRGLVQGSQQLRKELVWTIKAKLLFLVAAVLVIATAALVTWVLFTMAGLLTVPRWLVFFLSLYALQFFFFLFLSAGVILFLPIDVVWKKEIVAKAKKHLQKHSQVKVIAVAGSYGKTTMKNIIASVLGVRKHVVMTPESYNVPVSVARFILKNVDESTEAVVLEMGEHYPGDIAELCALAQPDISVITGINEAHLERMKNLETTVASIFEAVTYSKPNAAVILNADDANIESSYGKYCEGKKVIFYSSGKKGADYKIGAKNFNTKNMVWEFQVVKEKNMLGNFSISLLGEYGTGLAAGAAAVGELLGLSSSDIKLGLSQVRPVEHRLQPILGNENVLVIDDSYNGNPDGVREAVAVLGRFAGRRKLFITPGLVETGKSAEEVHKEIGRELAPVAEKVLLIKNSVTPFIAKGLAEAGYKKENILWFNSAVEAHGKLGSILKPGDVILFQNDWGDQYI